MASKGMRQLAATRALIEGLFELPPASDAEFRQRAADVDPVAGRQVLLELLQQELLDEGNGDVFLSLAQQTDLAQEKKRLLELAENEATASGARYLALNVLIDHDPTMLEREGLSIEPETMLKLMDISNRQLLAFALEDPAGSAEVASMLLDATQRQQDMPFEMLEHSRRRWAAPAAFVYRDALCRSELAPLHKSMLAAIVAEGGMVGIKALEELMARADGEPLQRETLAALMTLRTRALQGDRRRNGGDHPFAGKDHPLEAAAYLSNCDGQGTFVLLIRTVLDGKRVNVADLCIRVAADVRDGFIIAAREPEDYQEITDMLLEESATQLVRVPLSHATDLIAAGVERTLAGGRSLDVKAEMAVHYAEWLTRLASEEEGWLPPAGAAAPEPSPSLRGTDLRKLLNDPLYGSWFFDKGDLEGIDVTRFAPDARDVRNDVLMQDAMSALDSEPIRARVSAMAQHMAWWHAWRGETDRASWCAAAARTVERDFRRSELVRLMVTRSLRTAMEPEVPGEATVPLSFGDPRQRQQLRQEIFPRLQHPKGKHLAVLDLTEAALIALRVAINDVPGELRPPDPVLPGIAAAIGKACAEMVLEDNVPSDVATDPQLCRRTLKTILRLTVLDDVTGLDLLVQVTSHLDDFYGSICASCPVYCFDRPTSNMTAAFFDPVHPAMTND